ncbi:hypothetical protein RN001_005519 [Aquatica leii]|uniref:Carbonyl reductase [NADPH] 1 n=1 Tax=Aquatica leii TaxID=1421715 RepID=A0AAN7Q792_9COLE|nr:hypothetical protein RN001_005519 [Aquatica leii]
METKVAVVTGANKGIGYAIVKGLCENFYGNVYLTSRNESLGQQAVSQLESMGYHPKFYQLDITDQDSINKFRDHIQETEKGIDVLINNAGIAYLLNTTDSAIKPADIIISTNYFGTLRVCETLFPLLRFNAQVVNISSSTGRLSSIPSKELKKQFSDPNLTIEQLNALMKDFVRDTRNNAHIANGWCKYPYTASKVGLSALTVIQQKYFDKEISNRNISVNSVHPGYVETDMTRYVPIKTSRDQSPLTTEEGSRAPLYLALGGHGLKGYYNMCVQTMSKQKKYIALSEKIFLTDLVSQHRNEIESIKTDAVNASEKKTWAIITTEFNSVPDHTKVTGANKGIGYAIVKGLCENLNCKVYLTARNEILGKQAVSKLKELGYHPQFHQLDITDQESINTFRNYIKENEGGIDILVNNAAIAYPVDVKEFSMELDLLIISTNYLGSLHVCETLFPLLRRNSQVVNVSSSVGHSSFIPSENIKSRFCDPNLTLNQLNQLMETYVRDLKNNVHIKYGWHENAYIMSKIALSALTIVQQRQFNEEAQNQNISVNSVNPGYVDTDMSAHTGILTVEEGARAPLFLALGNHSLKGQFVWKDLTVLDWYDSNTPELF